MKYILSLLLIFLTFSIPLLSEETPHLILYFDINETLIASDKAGKKSVEDILNERLAKKYKACWDESIQEAITFDEYVNKILVNGFENPEIKDQRRSYLHHFTDYLLEQNHPLANKVFEDYENTLMILKNSNHIIFPSFYSLIDDLDRKGISYSLILRSFGEEIEDVKTEIHSLRQINFSKSGKFREGKLFFNEEGTENDSTIYNQLRSLEHADIHDDWNYWNAHNNSAKQSKPFYVDREDRRTLSIFFDDNIRENDEVKNIIAPLDAATGELIPIQDLVESGQAVRVDTLKAIVNLDYYINHIEVAIYKHSLKK